MATAVCHFPDCLLFEIQYRSMKQHAIADALSHLPVLGEDADLEEDETSSLAVKQIEQLPITA